MADSGVHQMSRRAIAMLRATAAGRAELTHSCEPDLRVDSLLCCDQATSRLLAHSGLIECLTGGAIGQWMPAQLTAAGRCALAQAEADARREQVLTAA